jgi:cytochrome c-type biogenesis protein
VLQQLIEGTGELIHANPWLAVLAVFLGGVGSAAAPCVLAIVPLMMSFVAGRKEEGLGTLRAFGYSLVFVLGLSISFTALGLLAALAGRMYGEVPAAWTWVVVVVCLVMGAKLLGLLRFEIPTPVQVQPKTRGLLGALLLGLLFGVVSAPCAAPILIVLLAYLAGSGASLWYGSLLLLVYALGHSVLVLVAGTSVGAARTLLESKRWAQASVWMKRASGLVIVLVGLYFALERLL